MAKQQNTQPTPSAEPRTAHKLDEVIATSPGLYRSVLVQDLKASSRKSTIALLCAHATEALTAGDLNALTDDEKAFVLAVMVCKGYVAG